MAGILGHSDPRITFDYCDIDQVGPGTDCTPDRPGCFGEQGDSLGSARLQMASAICYHSGGDWNVYPAMGDQELCGPMVSSFAMGRFDASSCQAIPRDGEC